MTCIRVSFLIWQRTKKFCLVLRLSYHICANNVRLLHSSSYFKWMPERKGSKSNIKNKENILCSEFYWGETLMWTFLAVLCLRIKLCKKQNKTLSNIIKFWASNLILSFKNLTSMLRNPTTISCRYTWKTETQNSILWILIKLMLQNLWSQISKFAF